jgi:hypothetical protein
MVVNTDPVTWNPQREVWETSQMDLFCEQPEPFAETWPTSFTTRAGRLYRLPPLELPTDENESSSSPTLPTPQAASVRSSRRAMVENRQWTHPALEQAIEIAQGILPREFRSWDEVPGRSRPTTDGLLPTPVTQPSTGNGHARNLGKEVQMLPSPRASDGRNGSPNQHGSSGDLMLPSAVLRLDE